MSGGEPLNAIAYGTLTGHLTRTLNALGLKREPIDVTPALHRYLDALPAETPRRRNSPRARTDAHAYPLAPAVAAVTVVTHIGGHRRGSHRYH